MNTIFEYTRFTMAPRQLQADPTSAKANFAARAKANGGKLFGCWRSMVGLGLARDEGIALTAWPDVETTQGAPAVDGAETHIMAATVRPTSDAPPTYEGVYVFRWFDVTADDWDDFRDLSNAAWPNMEDVFDVNICGFWKSVQTTGLTTRTLLLTRYADLSVWEASRWWNNPTAAADASMSRFKARNEMIAATVAYPTLPIFAA
jgi:hypothetical protein